MLIAIILSYFCGAIPFGVLVGRARGIDIRAVGSGNIGATNVWRALGPVAGTIVFALDVAKGFAGPWIGRLLLGENAHKGIAICAVVAVLGHTFSLFLKFRGGKGIATSLGAMMGLTLIPALLCFALWGVVLGVTRYISVASIIAAIAVPIAAYIAQAPKSYIAVIGVMGLVALIKHIPNMKRLLNGTEPKIGEKKVEAKVENVETSIKKIEIPVEELNGSHTEKPVMRSE